jgi:hypothetical protein
MTRLAVAIAALILVLGGGAAPAHDDGRYANSSLKSWFDGLASGKGPCCSNVDGVQVNDIDWDNQGPDGTYRVFVYGQWIVVPADAVVTQPNRAQVAIVWPYFDVTGRVQIRCFLAGPQG